MRVIAILNVKAGAVVKQGADTFRDGLRTAFAEAGITGDVLLVEGDAILAEAEKAVVRAKAGEIDAVVIGGGDGTVRSLAGLLAGTDIPLGVLPLGTLNHFAKDLRIPLPTDKAAAVIGAGHVVSVDVGEVNGRVFINNSSIGLYPYMVADRERRRSHGGVNKWLAMTLAFGRAVSRFPRRRVQVNAEGWSVPARTPFVFVGNNRYEVNILALGKRLSLDGGELSVYVARHRGAASFIWHSLRTVLGIPGRNGEMETFEVKSAEVQAQTSRLLVALDGEIETIETPLRYVIRPGALKVFAPQPAA